jgi:hypothetical protein
MSASSRIHIVQVLGGGKTKRLSLTPAQFRETVTTAKKRERFNRGRMVRVRQEGRVLRYKKEEKAA